MKKLLSLITAFVLILVLACPVNVQAATVKLSKAKATMEVDSTLKLKLGTIDTAKVSWKSSNTKIVTVAKTGTITAKKEGSATITATYQSKKYTCDVAVVDSNKIGSTKYLSKGDVVYEDENLKISFYKQEVNWSGDLDVSLMVENNYSDGIIIQCDTATINGYSFNNITMSDAVAKGKKGTVIIGIDNFDSDLVDRNKIYEFGADFRVMIGGLFSDNRLDVSFNYIK